MISTTETAEALILNLTGAIIIACVAEDAATLRAALASEKRLNLNLDELSGLDQAGLQLILASLKTGRFAFKPSPVLTRALLNAGLPNNATETGGNNE